MADQKISQLSDAGAPQDTDQLVLARTGTTLSLLWSSVKTALNALYVPLTRTITAGTGLTGGGDLSANRTLSIASGGITEGLIGLTDVTTDNVTSTAHGFAPKSPADATKFLNGATTPAYAQVKDSDLSTSDITTNDVSTTKHGFAPKSPNDATKYLDGTGAYSVPAGSGGRTDGWIDDTTNTWTFVSSTSFKLTGVDRTAVFTPGTRLRLKQGGAYKYFVVVSAAFSTDTTVTITGGSDYTLANAAITDNYYSYEANPQGYPGWFNFAPSATGFSGTPTVVTARFSVIGRCVHINVNVTGTSNSGSTGFTAPIATAQANNDLLGAGVDNSVSLTNPVQGFIGATGTGWSVFKDFAGSGWVAGGTKTFRLHGFYEM